MKLFSKYRKITGLLFFFSLLFIIPIFVFALGNKDTGYPAFKTDINDILGYKLSVPIFHNKADGVTKEPIGTCIANYGNVDYFIPTKTITEWDNFINNLPTNLYPQGCGGDGVCNSCPQAHGGYVPMPGTYCETCENSPEDCGACVYSCPASIVDSRDSKSYPIVRIGNQCWFAKNLDFGTQISGSINQTNNGVFEKYCYANTSGYCTVYGGLYQKDEAQNYSNTVGGQGLCPTDWHIPSAAEWDTLAATTGGYSSAGYYLKEAGNSHWAGNVTGINSYGFTALPGGRRDAPSGTFLEVTTVGNFTVSSGDVVTNLRRFWNTAADIQTNVGFGSAHGLSVRCVRNVYQVPDPSYVLSYTAASGGTISGNTSQTVLSGNNGTPVTAVADSGNIFLNWSDGSMVNPRVDTNITANRNITANFSQPCNGTVYDSRDANSYGVRYIAGNCWTVQNMKYLPSIDYSSKNSETKAYYYVYDYVPTWFSGGPDLDEAKALNNYSYLGTLYNKTAAASACPSGWSLPSKTEYETLDSVAGTESYSLKSHNYPGITAPEVYWNGSGGAGGDGDDSSKFGALPSGHYSSVFTDIFDEKNYSTMFWTSTPSGSGIQWAYTINKAIAVLGGYANGIASLDSGDGLPVRCISKQNYSLVYNAGNNGTLSGTKIQTIKKGSYGSYVTAVPNNGYIFVNWSDGVTTNPRQDTNVQANKIVTANFATGSCGDGICGNTESCDSCSSDCGECPYCGDGYCNGYESCGTVDSNNICSTDCYYCSCLYDTDCASTENPNGEYCGGSNPSSYCYGSFYGYYNGYYDYHDCAIFSNDQNTCEYYGCYFDPPYTGGCYSN
jgi:uncharacterized protein (TIGR02145 family)